MHKTKTATIIIIHHTQQRGAALDDSSSRPLIRTMRSVRSQQSSILNRIRILHPSSLLRLLFLLVSADLVSSATASNSGSSSITNNYNNNPASVDLGTTLVAIRYRDGVVVGADSRTSVGTYVSHRYAHKIAPIGRYCVVARSGSAAATQALAQRAVEHLESRWYRYGHAVNVAQMAHWLKGQVYQHHNDAATAGATVSLLVAGYDPVQKVPQLFSLSPSGALLEHNSQRNHDSIHSQYAVSGSGSSFIMGFLDHHCGNLRLDDDGEKNELDETTAVDLCVTALQLAMARDGSSGGVCRLVVINQAGRREWTVLPNGIRLDYSSSVN